MKIVFMGTPEFAAVSLDALVKAGHCIAGVFTQPDRPKGRGNKVIAPPVKQYALEHGFDVYQPLSFKKGDDAASAMETLHRLSPDIIVVAAYGRILPKEVLELPRYGCVNVHGSLLPAYRGAGPVQWCLINGETQTGVTIMQMAEGLDTGDMIESVTVDIGQDETADELMNRLAVCGGELLCKVLADIENGTAKAVPQDDSLSSYAPMISKDMAELDFTMSAKAVHDRIRGLSSNPGAYMMYGDRRIKVYRSTLDGRKFDLPAGTVGDKNTFTVVCGDGMGVTFTEVQAIGGKRMKTADFLRGNKL